MSILKSEAERARAQYANLVKHYRAIGPAAVAGALAAGKKKNKKPQPTQVKA
ncbi:transcriptional regulator [Pseudaminobacter sp. 19-2017]|uniref:Transcriptional regulator n=1 Tax=Pseudaminobacter soli (ex Zhang et al. 2022) TaxID=2831468 RepID=A0A942I334_9HYPH|nr:transcriptional regulator [Pseudaminobacter soli]MBS3650657.1 transcriptional regulator [Pseudaminobacter soli]